MERRATSPDNPWIQALGVLAIIGLLVACGAVFLGYQISTEESDFDPVLGPLLMSAGVALGGASLVAIALGLGLRAYLWERRNNPQTYTGSSTASGTPQSLGFPPALQVPPASTGGHHLRFALAPRTPGPGHGRPPAPVPSLMRGDGGV